MRFCANVSILFGDAPFLERFARAAAAGLRAVEFWWPAGEDPGAVADAVAGAGVEVPLFNFDAGDMAAGDRGLLADPARVEQFRANVPVALDLARRGRGPRVTALVGRARPGGARHEQLALAAGQVRWAADEAARHGIDVMIEPVNT